MGPMSRHLQVQGTAAVEDAAQGRAESEEQTALGALESQTTIRTAEAPVRREEPRNEPPCVDELSQAAQSKLFQERLEASKERPVHPRRDGKS